MDLHYQFKHGALPKGGNKRQEEGPDQHLQGLRGTTGSLVRHLPRCLSQARRRAQGAGAHPNRTGAIPPADHQNSQANAIPGARGWETPNSSPEPVKSNSPDGCAAPHQKTKDPCPVECARQHARRCGGHNDASLEAARSGRRIHRIRDRPGVRGSLTQAVGVTLCWIGCGRERGAQGGAANRQET